VNDDVMFRQQLERRIASYRARKTALREHAAEIEAEIAEITRRCTSTEELYEAEFGAPFSGLGAAEAAPGEPTSSTSGPLTGLPWADALVRVLDEHGPAHVKEIWRLLESGGFRTDARDPLRSIVAIALRLEPAVIRVAPNTYALTNGRPGAAYVQEQLTTG